MTIHFTTTTSLDYFANLVYDDDAIPLFEAAMLIAQDADPAIDLSATQSDMDGITTKLQQRIRSKHNDIQKLRLLIHYFYQDLGFGPNLNDYYDPNNSYLHCVLANRRGIPISLAVLFIEMAQQIGLRVQGISFPGHFLLKLAVADGDIILDPMTGSSLSFEHISQLLTPHIYLDPTHLVHDEEMEEFTRAQLRHFLQTATRREILVRMLRNLKYIFANDGDWHKVLPVLQRLAILEPDNLQTIRDRGFAFANADMPEEALQDLQLYLRVQIDAQDEDEVRAMLPSLEEAARRY